MVSLITVHNSDGCVGRCDAHCYMAKSPRCACICGGKNHGVGLKRALDHNAERVGLKPDDLAKFAQQRKVEPESLFVCDRLQFRSRTRVRRILKEHFNPTPKDGLFEEAG